MSSLYEIEVERVRGGRRTVARDCAAVEEPLEIRLHGRPFSVVMRTPGADRELAAGFLLAERVIGGADDLGTIEYCTDESAAAPRRPGRGRQDDGGVVRRTAANVINVTLADPSRVDAVFAGRRQVTTHASCGLCGRLTIESLTSDAALPAAAWTVSPHAIARLAAALGASQPLFRETGGLHAAGLFTRDGHLADSAEDVGRHNAVDKVIGRAAITERLPLSDHLLFVSGRTSFEIVQKALFGGIPLIASVSAPSSLAIDLAAATGQTLIGFVRGDTFNIYTGGQRIQ
jgi:FdhD protein